MWGANVVGRGGVSLVVPMLPSRDSDSVLKAPERPSGKLNPCLLLAAKRETLKMTKNTWSSLSSPITER